jgi:hypothetical protein
MHSHHAGFWRMDLKVRRVEVKADTADLLEARAAALGMSVADLLAAIAGQGANAAAGAELSRAAEGTAQDGVSDTTASEPALAARRWVEVKAWIDSWGKPNELPRPKFGKL